MEATVENRSKLRRLIDEKIPPGGTDADTRFVDADLDEFLIESTVIEEAAAKAWTEKAAQAMSLNSGLLETQAGDERVRFLNPETYRDHCLAMAEMYRSRVPGKGSRLFAYDPPDVLGTEGTG